jgi:hypothetical protein
MSFDFDSVSGIGAKGELILREQRQLPGAFACGKITRRGCFQ